MMGTCFIGRGVCTPPYPSKEANHLPSCFSFPLESFPRPRALTLLSELSCSVGCPLESQFFERDFVSHTLQRWIPHWPEESGTSPYKPGGREGGHQRALLILEQHCLILSMTMWAVQCSVAIELEMWLV